MRSLGIDVGVTKGLDLVLLDEGRVLLEAHRRVPAAGLRRIIRAASPDVVAIDSPPAFGSDGPSRGAERELRALGIHSYAVPSDRHTRKNRFYDWMRAGIKAFDIVAGEGYSRYLRGRSVRNTAIEVFPHASAVVLKGALPPLGLSRSASRKRRWRAAVLEAHGVVTDGLGSVDQVDAALAAVTGLLALEGRFTAVGNPDEGIVVLPATELPARFRREREATDTDRPDPIPGLAPCECGCGETVRGRFRPGHDARLKYRLWDEVRTGELARDTLAHLGWQPPPEIAR